MLDPGVAPLFWRFALDILISFASEFRNRIFTVCPVGKNSSCTMPSLSTFATISVVVPIKRRPERFSSSTDIRQFLKRLNVWPRALSPNAPLSILCVSDGLLQSLKQNLMQIFRFFTSVNLAGRYDRKTALTRRHKNAQKNTHTSS